MARYILGGGGYILPCPPASVEYIAPPDPMRGYIFLGEELVVEGK